MPPLRLGVGWSTLGGAPGQGGGAPQMVAAHRAGQEQITKGRNQPFAAALSAVLMVLTSVMIRLYRKITGTSQLEGML